MAGSGRNFFVITGGPGAGKTTLLEELRRRGVACVGESARRIIQTQREFGGRALHSVDPALYAELMLQYDVASYLAADQNVATVFDRSVIDTLGYPEFMGLPTPAHFHTAAARCRYNPAVFIAPPWEEIYVHDAERKHSLAEARRGYEAAVTIYGAQGYRLVELPRTSVEERAEFVLERIRAADGNGSP